MLCLPLKILGNGDLEILQRYTDGEVKTAKYKNHLLAVSRAWVGGADLSPPIKKNNIVQKDCKNPKTYRVSVVFFGYILASCISFSVKIILIIFTNV